ncbi:hypothetical protein IFM89_023090 [Coptis chinensis]|uniref:Bifunctional inhibitor/plant lipid transfer protein/seed storage helical domain-containing protein n=1 Tax=Coptis chinensis TaxID=261450 RepID=A0A835LV30_9MAGN|nr:hypothetical protein IFM89_023090 [Coptis chinensis]
MHIHGLSYQRTPSTLYKVTSAMAEEHRVISMEKSQALVVVVMLVVLFGVSGNKITSSKALILCNLNQDDLITCKPAVTKPNPVDPTSDCCTALTKANLTCLCSYKNSMVLPLYGIDPDLAMKLPEKCSLTPPTTCT